MSSTLFPKIAKSLSRKRRDERAKRRDERTNGDSKDNINFSAYVTYVCSMQDSDIRKPRWDLNETSLKDKNIESGDLVWLGPRCSNSVGVISSVDYEDDETVVKIPTNTGFKHLILQSRDVMIKRKARHMTPIGQFRL